MGINAFLGVNLYEREDIENNSSQWNSNCYYDKGLLRLQHFTVPKNPIKSKIYEREYELADDIEVDGGADFVLYEGQNYRTKGFLTYEHAGDGHSMWEHGIPKPTVRLYFDYNNDEDIPDHYHNILDSLYNDGAGVINEDFYDAIVQNLKDSDMVAECEIGVTYSGPYGESAMTYFKIANNMPYFFLEVVLFNELNNLNSYDRYKNIKYLNVYVKYEFMTDYMLLDRYDFEVSDTKENLIPGNRNRYERFDPNSSVGMDFRYPFIEFGEIDYPFVDEEDQTTKNVLWYSSGFFKYESDEKPALQWFIPNKLIAAVPQIITEQQTYIADEDIEVIDDESYDKLKEFWDKSDTDDLSDYITNDMANQVVIYTNTYGRDGDNIDADGIVLEYESNIAIKSTPFNIWVAKDNESVGEHDAIFNSSTSTVLKGLEVYDGSGDPINDSIGPVHRYGVLFDTYTNTIHTQAMKQFVLIDRAELTESYAQEFIVHKYLISEGKKIFLETFNYTVEGKGHDIILKDISIDAFFKTPYQNIDDADDYMFEIWLEDTGLFRLLQRFSLSGVYNFVSGFGEADVLNGHSYDVTEEYTCGPKGYNYYINGEYSEGIQTVSPGDSIRTVDFDELMLSSDWAKDRGAIPSYSVRRHENAIVSCRTGEAKDKVHFPHNFFSVNGSNGSFCNALDVFYNEDTNKFEIYYGYNAKFVEKGQFWLEVVETIDETIKSVEYNYDELYKIVKYGVAIECPNNFDDMYQKEVVSKHAIYMERLFKAIIDENGKSLLYFSEQAYPESFSQTNLFKFDDEIVHLETFKKQFYIFLPEEIQVLSGSNNLTFILDEYYTDGAYEYTVVKHENQMLFTNKKGVYSISHGSYPQLLSLNIQMFFDEGLIDIEYAEVLTNKGVDFYVLNLNESISPIDVGTIHANEFGMLLEQGTYNEQGTDWSFTSSEEFVDETNERFAINKIAICLRDNTIWFGTENDTDEYLWKSAEFVQESFFKLKSFKRLILDFAGKVSTVFGKNRKVPVTFKRLPMPGAAAALGESKKPTMKYTKDMPIDWAVEGQRSYSNSIVFLSEHKNTILYKWEVLESGYNDTDN